MEQALYFGLVTLLSVCLGMTIGALLPFRMPMMPTLGLVLFVAWVQLPLLMVGLTFSNLDPERSRQMPSLNDKRYAYGPDPNPNTFGLGCVEQLLGLAPRRRKARTPAPPASSASEPIKPAAALGAALLQSRHVRILGGASRLPGYGLGFGRRGDRQHLTNLLLRVLAVAVAVVLAYVAVVTALIAVLLEGEMLDCGIADRFDAEEIRVEKSFARLFEVNADCGALDGKGYRGEPGWGAAQTAADIAVVEAMVCLYAMGWSMMQRTRSVWNANPRPESDDDYDDGDGEAAAAAAAGGNKSTIRRRLPFRNAAYGACVAAAVAADAIFLSLRINSRPGLGHALAMVPEAVWIALIVW